MNGKHNHAAKAFMIASFFMLGGGCATTRTVTGALGDGEGLSERISGRSYSEVYRAARKVMASRFAITAQRASDGVIVGEARPGATTWGEVVGVLITQAGDRVIRVRVVSRKRYRLQLTGQNWERSVLAAIRAELDG